MGNSHIKFASDNNLDLLHLLQRETIKFLKIICDWSILFRTSLTNRKKYLLSLQVTVVLFLNLKRIESHFFCGNKIRNDRSSPSEVFLGKGILNIYSKFIGKHLCRSVISIKLQSNFTEIVLQHVCSSVNLS